MKILILCILMLCIGLAIARFNRRNKKSEGKENKDCGVIVNSKGDIEITRVAKSGKEAIDQIDSISAYFDEKNRRMEEEMNAELDKRMRTK